jgi:hypothetical protein
VTHARRPTRPVDVGRLKTGVRKCAGPQLRDVRLMESVESGVVVPQSNTQPCARKRDGFAVDARSRRARMALEHVQ